MASYILARDDRMARPITVLATILSLVSVVLVVVSWVLSDLLSKGSHIQLALLVLAGSLGPVGLGYAVYTWMTVSIDSLIEPEELELEPEDLTPTAWKAPLESEYKSEPYRLNHEKYLI